MVRRESSIKRIRHHDFGVVSFRLLSKIVCFCIKAFLSTTKRCVCNANVMCVANDGFFAYGKNDLSTFYRRALELDLSVVQHGAAHWTHTWFINMRNRRESLPFAVGSRFIMSSLHSIFSIEFMKITKKIQSSFQCFFFYLEKLFRNCIQRHICYCLFP